MIFAIQMFQIFEVHEKRYHELSQHQKRHDHHRERHCHVGPRRKTEENEDAQLHELSQSESMYGALRTSPDVMVRRVRL